jgi:hypothetical protein
MQRINEDIEKTKPKQFKRSYSANKFNNENYSIPENIQEYQNKKKENIKQLESLMLHV